MNSQADHSQQNEMILKLEVMLDDLSQYHRDRNELRELYIQDRIKKSTESYLNSIQDSLDYLKSKRSKYLLRKIKKL